MRGGQVEISRDLEQVSPLAYHLEFFRSHHFHCGFCFQYAEEAVTAALGPERGNWLRQLEVG